MKKKQSNTFSTLLLLFMQISQICTLPRTRVFIFTNLWTWTSTQIVNAFATLGNELQSAFIRMLRIP